MMSSRQFCGSTGWKVALLAVSVLLKVAASFGGSMVFDYGFNVETGGDHPAYHTSETDVFPGQP